MADNESSMPKRHFKSACALVESQQADLIIKESSKGKIYFSCGEIERGYCSKAVIAAYQAGTLSLEDMDFAECSKDNKTWVPCLMMKPKGQKVLKTFSFRL